MLGDKTPRNPDELKLLKIDKWEDKSIVVWTHVRAITITNIVIADKKIPLWTINYMKTADYNNEHDVLASVTYTHGICSIKSENAIHIFVEDTHTWTLIYLLYYREI